MAKYECKICGYEFDEQQAGELFENLYSCPICDADKSCFVMTEGDPEEKKEETEEEASEATDEFVFEDVEEEKTETEEIKSEEVNDTESEEAEERETFEEFLKKIEELSKKNITELIILLQQLLKKK